MLKIKIFLVLPTKFEDEELLSLLHEDTSKTLAEFTVSLGVDSITVSKHLKALVIIRKKCHLVPRKWKPEEVEQQKSFFTY